MRTVAFALWVLAFTLWAVAVLQLSDGREVWAILSLAVAGLCLGAGSEIYEEAE